jgi:hypothetical protein
MVLADQLEKICDTSKSSNLQGEIEAVFIGCRAMELKAIEAAATYGRETVKICFGYHCYASLVDR